MVPQQVRKVPLTMQHNVEQPVKVEEKKTKKHVCRDAYERPGCLIEADERYTMRFDDLGEEPLYWCSHCGPQVKAQLAMIESRLSGPGGAAFAVELDGAIEDVESKRTYS